jgi:hypothetical protein
MPNPCEHCGGTGVIERLEGMPKECQCAVLRRVAASMPAQVRHADLRYEHLNLPLLKEGIGKSYFIRAAREDVYAIIKAVMMINSSKFIRITSDRELRDVYVGSTSRRSRGDDADIVINTLEEVMGPPSLCIIQLDELKSRNKAAAAILEEALCIRLNCDKPTWAVSYSDSPFGNGSIAYSDAVWGLLKHSMNELVIPRIVAAATPTSNTNTSAFAPEQVASQVAPQRIQPTPVERPAPAPRRIRSADPDPDLPKGFENFGQGVKPSKGFSRRGD